MHSVVRHATGLYGSCAGEHDVPWDVKSASLEQFLPPWTVQRQVWSDSLKQQHSGVSTDMLLFSDINLSLIHHYRTHKRGLLHVAFQKNYMSRLRALLPLLAQPTDSVLSPVSTGPGSIRQASSAELVGESPRRTRRAKMFSGPPSGMAPMDQYLPRDPSLLLRESTDFLFLQAPLTYRPIGEKMVSGSAVGSPTREPVVAASLSMPDLSREGPFDVHQDASRSGVGQSAGLSIPHDFI